MKTILSPQTRADLIAFLFIISVILLLLVAIGSITSTFPQSPEGSGLPDYY